MDLRCIRQDIEAKSELQTNVQRKLILPTYSKEIPWSLECSGGKAFLRYPRPHWEVSAQCTPELFETRIFSQKSLHHWKISQTKH